MTVTDVRAEFTALYRAHYPAVLAFLRRRVPEGVAEELTADTFGRAWKNFDTLRAAPLPWLYGIARNTMREFYRAQSSRPGAEPLEDYDSARADFAAGIDLSLDVNRALLTLPFAEREILTLHVWEGLSPAELAEVLDISPANARVRLHRARTHLATALEAS